MNIKHFFVTLMCSVFMVTTNMKSVVVVNEIVNVNEQITLKVKNIVNRMASNTQEELDTEDPNVILERAINNYNVEFEDYINITGLNVNEKELITLPNFDINYIAPDYTDIMHDYQVNFESSLTTEELNQVIEMRKSNYEFDKYATLNENRYKNLNIRPKYANQRATQTQRSAVLVSGLTSILTSAGLSQAVISAFTGCVTALSAALSSSWIPIVGWIIAVALAVGALIAITAIIVQYWEEIVTVINDIKDWFVEQFNSFANLINSYFDDAISKGNESTIAKRVNVGGKNLDFIDKIVTTQVLSDIANDCRRNKNVWLLGHIGNPSTENGKHWWICYDKVDEEFVTKYDLYDYGICTYTWYNNTAKRMMANGSKTINGNTSLLLYDRTIDQNDAFGWNHYHLGVMKNGVLVRNEAKPFSWAHSFFGLLYINNNGTYVTYPTNP